MTDKQKLARIKDFITSHAAEINEWGACNEAQEELNEIKEELGISVDAEQFASSFRINQASSFVIGEEIFDQFGSKSELFDYIDMNINDPDAPKLALIDKDYNVLAETNDFSFEWEIDE